MAWATSMQPTECWPSPTKGERKEEAFVDWLEQGLDLLTLTCDENAKATLPAALLLQNAATPRAPVHDYAKMHDEFLESLLQEQALKQATAGSLPPIEQCNSSVTDASSISSSSPKNRRPLKLNRPRPVTNTPRPSKRQVAVGDDAAPMHLALVTSSPLPAPETFLHPQCRMQKDKVKGETPGNDICATGRDACLEKLRQKMELLTQVAARTDSSSSTKKKKPSADMKHRKARVTEITHIYTETRSLIELRMGFLSMQYGILLRWASGRVTLVVLRKMCPESFYNKVLKQAPPDESPPCVERRMPSSYFLVGNNHVLIQRDDGTEVSLLDAPYRVARPAEFAPSLLNVSIVSLEGMKPKALYSIELHFQGMTHKSRLTWHADRACFAPRADSAESVEWEIPESIMDLAIQVHLYQQRRPPQTRKRFVSRTTVSLASLTPQPKSYPQPKHMVIPLQDGVLTLRVSHQSDHMLWLHQEMEARKREEVSGFMWKAPFFRPREQVVEEDEEEDDLLTNMCCTWFSPPSES